MGPLWREMPVPRTFLYISFRVSSKGALSPGSPHRSLREKERERETLHFQRPLLLSVEAPSKWTSPPGSPMGSLWKEMPLSIAFLYISFRTPSRGALPPGSPHRASIERCSISSALFHLYLRVPVKWAPLQVLQWALTERDARFQSFLLHTFQSPQ